jgi:two-component system cell cycle sensor histidine kinase/response regulator CckA
LRVLILEDVPMDAELMEYELGRAGIAFAARCVHIREEFVRELTAFQPDVILADYTLPRFDGMSALKLARELAPSVPFLIVTGSVNEETAVGCMRAGATDYLLKGNLSRIGPAIDGALARERARAEQARAEQALRESEERYRDLFENASDLICVAAPDGHFLYVNRAWHEALGYDNGELAERQLLDLVHPDNRADFADTLRRVLAGGTVTRFEVVFLSKEGAAITVEGNASCTFKHGIPTTIRGIYRDVTERKRVEDHLRRAERMQAAGRLAGGVAHEVNNMMTGVIGFSEFLLRSLPSGDPRRADVQEIIKAGTRAADVTRQLLAFTRQQLLRPQVLDINLVVRDLERMLRRSLGEDHQLLLRLGLDGGEVRADRGQLEQVLINLVLNARDALGDRGSVTIETAAVTLDESYGQRHDGVDIPFGPYVMLAVSDDGCGMDTDVQARIFEPFFTTKPVGQGTGLGLSTVYGIVKQSGGFVWVYSEPGEGTAFKVYLPRVREVAPSAEPPPVAALKQGGNERILVVEDEDVVRSLAQRGLQEHGYDVIEARDGTEALDYILRHPDGVDLVISDVVMPEMGGRELGQRLAEVAPELPVLYTSGFTGDDVVQRGLLDPGSPFEQKPFSPDRLAAKVREMLDRRASARPPAPR